MVVPGYKNERIKQQSKPMTERWRKRKKEINEICVF